MRHARSHGIVEAPEVLGFSSEGDHERLRWIPGDDVGVKLGDDDDLRSVGTLVRRVHDALASFEAPAAASWRLRIDGPTFIHGDIAPWNVVWSDGRIVGLLDWDQSGPGRDLEDLAYAAWVWVPLEVPKAVPSHWLVEDVSLQAQQHRLRVLVDAYGLDDGQRQSFLSEVAYVQATGAARIAVGAATGDSGMSNIWWEGRRVGVFGTAMTWLAENWLPLSDAVARG